jgi:hypothetical protein
MSTALFLVLFLSIPLAVLVFALNRNKKAKAREIETTCGTVPAPGGTLAPSFWHIGPRSRVWGNRSPGMPEHPGYHPEGFVIDLPTHEASQVGYVTFNHGSLAGKTQIRMRYRLELSPGAKVYAVSQADRSSTVYPAMLTLYFQREGDDWSAGGKFETYRWFATLANDGNNYLREGEVEIVVPLERVWTATQDSNAVDQRPAFEAAKASACCVGFVLGGNENSVGHGARSTGDARLVVTKFEVT